jgi:TATA-binding protein-associated factor Taf7
MDQRRPSSPLSSTSAITPAQTAHDGDIGDDMSDSDLSQFEAEIEQNLSSASPESSPVNGANDDDDNVSEDDDAMDVDSEEDVKPSYANKGRHRASTKEYYDPELFGLRRSVCPLFSDIVRCLLGILKLIRVGSCAC